MTGQELYEKWEVFRVDLKTRRPIGKASLGQHQIVWGKWLMQCTEVQVPWDKATPEDVQAFLDAIEPCGKRGSPTTSVMTINRYWRALHELYDYAVTHELVAINPANLPKKPLSEEVLSLALTPQHWQQLSDGLPGGFTPRERRNRLVLLLHMRAALTVRELACLTLEDVDIISAITFEEAAANSEPPLFQPESPNWKATVDHPIYSVTIVNANPVRNRTLTLDGRTSKAVFDWLECRAYIGKDKMMSSGDKQYLIAAGDGSKPMHAKAIYNICHAHFLKCLGANNKIQHLGPNTLRNTCIKIWHSLGTPDSIIMRRLGLKAPGALRRLRKQFEPSLSLQ